MRMSGTHAAPLPSAVHLPSAHSHQERRCVCGLPGSGEAGNLQALQQCRAPRTLPARSLEAPRWTQCPGKSPPASCA